MLFRGFAVKQPCIVPNRQVDSTLKVEVFSVSLFYRLKETALSVWFRPRRLILVLLGLLVLSSAPLAYHESWLDPFSTLDVPNRLLKPHTITAIGLVPAENPGQTLVLREPARVRELMHDLYEAVPHQGTEFSSPDQILHFTLHRDATRFHTAADFALEFDPQQGLVRMAGQAFRIPEAGQLYLTNLSKSMQPGWVQ